MECPLCGIINPDNTIICGCGYNFTTQKKVLYRSFTHMGVKEFFLNSWCTFGIAWRTFLLLGTIYTLAITINTRVSQSTGEVSWIISLILLVITTIALTIAANKASDGKDIGIRGSYALSLSLGLFWRYIWTWVIYFLIIAPIAVFSFLLFFTRLFTHLFCTRIPSEYHCTGIIFIFSIQSIIPIISIIPLIIMIIWSIRYILAPHAVIIEGLNARQALSLSATLMEGRKFSIFWRELGFGLFFALKVGIPLALLTSLFATVLGQTYIEAITTFGKTIWEMFLLIFNVLLFKSLRYSLKMEDDKEALLVRVRKSNLKVGYSMIVIGIGTVIGSLLAFNQTQNFIKNYPQAEGIVTELLSEKVSNVSHVYYPLIKFETGKREIIEFKSGSGSYPPPYNVGEKVSILYNPDNIKQAEIKTFFSLWRDFILLFVGGVMLTGVGLTWCLQNRE